MPSRHVNGLFSKNQEVKSKIKQDQKLIFTSSKLPCNVNWNKDINLCIKLQINILATIINNSITSSKTIPCFQAVFQIPCINGQ